MVNATGVGPLRLTLTTQRGLLSQRICPHCDRDHDETTSNNGPPSLVCGNEPNKPKDRGGKLHIVIPLIIRILCIQEKSIQFIFCHYFHKEIKLKRDMDFEMN